MIIKSPLMVRTFGCWATLFVIASLIPIWSIPHTMAARNILLAISLAGIFILRLDWKIYKGRLDILFIFFGYLIIHLLFFSTDLALAFKNFRGEWLKFILFFILGLGTALLSHECRLKRILLWVGALFALPLFIHIFLALYFWGNNPNNFPWGYLGMSAMHGDLGYTSLMATIFLCVYFCFQASKKREYIFTLLCLMVCVASPAIARSRGGLFFSILAIALIAMYGLFDKFRTSRAFFKAGLLIAPLLLFIAVIANIAISSDPVRWQGLTSNVKMGATAAAMPFEVVCNGTQALSDKLSRDKALNSESLDQIKGLTGGDGARVVALFVGLGLIVENPMGINQSRQAFMVALKKHCNLILGPTLTNAHNGWVNAALSIGILGAIILMSLYIYLLRATYDLHNRDQWSHGYAVALMFAVVLWLTRAFFDATMQDQMLEMQSFSLALLFGLAIPKK